MTKYATGATIRNHQIAPVAGSARITIRGDTLNGSREQHYAPNFPPPKAAQRPTQRQAASLPMTQANFFRGRVQHRRGALCEDR